MTEEQRYNRLLLVYIYVEGKLSVNALESIFDVVGSQSMNLRLEYQEEAQARFGGKTIAEVRALVGMPAARRREESGK